MVKTSPGGGKGEKWKFWGKRASSIFGNFGTQFSKILKMFWSTRDRFFCCYLYAFSPFLIEFAHSAQMEFRMVPGQSHQRPQGASGCFYMLPGFRTAHPECNQPKKRNRQNAFRWSAYRAPARFSSGTATSCKASAAASGPNDPGPVPPAHNIFALGPEKKKPQFSFSEILEISKKRLFQGEMSDFSSFNTVLGYKATSDDLGSAHNQFYMQFPTLLIFHPIPDIVILGNFRHPRTYFPGQVSHFLCWY